MKHCTCCRKKSSSILLLEAANDFFSYEPVLKALQASDEATIPFPELLKLCPAKDVSCALLRYFSPPNWQNFDVLMCLDSGQNFLLPGTSFKQPCYGIAC